jgi:hypothetical protein
MRTRCDSLYPGVATLLGRPIPCGDVAGHDGPHGNSFAARYWTDDDRPVFAPVDPSDYANEWRAHLRRVEAWRSARYARGDR